jgi:hypothetical protein
MTLEERGRPHLVAIPALQASPTIVDRPSTVRFLCAERRGEQPRASECEPRSAQLRRSTSAPRLPASRVPSTMDDGKYNDLIGHRVEIDRVREASHERAACLTWTRGYARGAWRMAASALSISVAKAPPSPGRWSSYQSRASSSAASACGRRTRRGVTLLGGASDAPLPRERLKWGQRCAQQGGGRVQRVARG